MLGSRRKRTAPSPPSMRTAIAIQQTTPSPSQLPPSSKKKKKKVGGGGGGGAGIKETSKNKPTTSDTPRKEKQQNTTLLCYRIGLVHFLLWAAPVQCNAQMSPQSSRLCSWISAVLCSAGVWGQGPGGSLPSDGRQAGHQHLPCAAGGGPHEPGSQHHRQHHLLQLLRQVLMQVSFRYQFHPCVTAAACKRYPGHSAKSAGGRLCQNKHEPSVCGL